MLRELIFVGGIWFWFAVISMTVVEIIAIERESGLLATLCLFVTVAAMVAFSDFNPLLLIADHPFLTVFCIVAYIAIGVAWSIVKWYFFSLKLADEYSEVRAKFFKTEAISGTELPADKKKQFQDYVRNYMRGRFPPVARDNKASIILWMSYWPFSAVWTLVNDPVRHIFRYIYGRIVGILQTISDRAFSKYHADFQVNKPQDDKNSSTH